MTPWKLFLVLYVTISMALCVLGGLIVGSVSLLLALSAASVAAGVAALIVQHVIDTHGSD